MAFENFYRQGRGRVTVTVVKNTVRLSSAALRMLDDPEYVDILYDRDANILAFRSTAPDDPDGFHVNRSAGIRIGEVIAHFGLDLPQRSVRYEASVNGDGMLTVDLNQQGEPASRTKRSRPVVRTGGGLPDETFSSVTQAADWCLQTSGRGDSTNLYTAISMNRPAYGYRWAYAPESESE